MKSILDKSFKYTPSASTNLWETFERVRRQQKAEAKAKALGNEKTGTGADIRDIAEAKRGQAR